jgi:hypothetical protein
MSQEASLGVQGLSELLLGALWPCLTPTPPPPLPQPATAPTIYGCPLPCASRIFGNGLKAVIQGPEGCWRAVGRSPGRQALC